MINQIELKNMHSRELRTLRNMIRKELDFRADVGSELDNRDAWVSSTEWGKKVQEMRKEERESAAAYSDEFHSCKIS